MLSLETSTSQLFLVALPVLSLLAIAALLWVNHRTLPPARRAVVLNLAGGLSPVDLVVRDSQTFSLRLSARPPPTFSFPSIPVMTLLGLRASTPDTVLMVRPVSDSAKVSR